MRLTKVKMRIIAFIVGIAVINFIMPTYNYKVKAEIMDNSQKIEEILKTIIQEYGETNIIFKDGIVLKENESISLNELLEDASINWFSKDTEIAKVTDENQLETLSTGTTFLIGEKDGKYNVIQLYVSPLNKASRSISAYNNNVRKGQYVVYLDPGHGGSDPGSSGNGIVEKDLNLKLALGVRDRLQNLGVKVIMSRDTDKFVALQDISGGANAANPDVFVSIHQNSFTTAAPYGIETYYNKEMDKAVANSLQNNLIKNTNAYNRGVKFGDLHVVRETYMPASLVECGFLSNPDEANLLKSESYQNKIMDAIANGTYEYLKTNVSLDALIANRVYGNTRFETSYKLFDMGWSSSETVILANGMDYPDALTAAPLAGKYNAPILLSRNTTLASQPDLKASLVNKGVKNVIIIGGETAISSGIQNEISSLGINVRRIGGRDRYETSVLIAKEVGVNNGEISLAYGMSFADGLSISSVAAKKQSPILLTRTDYIPDVVKAFINENNINKTYIIGSTTVITDGVVAQTKGPERLGGANRYETNAKIFQRFKSEINLDTVFIASGLAFPDALSSSALAAKNSNFVLLSNIRQVEGTVRNILTEIRPNLKNIYVLGSNVVIADYILTGLGIDIIR
ncbi:cell wall-binding repeat-containing protein [Clostridium tertium]|uniref:cell wall-binding repeat-containing protein n=1 Tax=Clostridium tertium TaxID=1559 RepID=UPI00241D122E|nr:cell wall-binding repeat-containing protein [Clostridium tertium]